MFGCSVMPECARVGGLEVTLVTHQKIVLLLPATVGLVTPQSVKSVGDLAVRTLLVFLPDFTFETRPVLFLVIEEVDNRVELCQTLFALGVTVVRLFHVDFQVLP